MQGRRRTHRGIADRQEKPLEPNQRQAQAIETEKKEERIDKNRGAEPAFKQGRVAERTPPPCFECLRVKFDGQPDILLACNITPCFVDIGVVVTRRFHPTGREDSKFDRFWILGHSFRATDTRLCHIAPRNSNDHPQRSNILQVDDGPMKEYHISCSSLTPLVAS